MRHDHLMANPDRQRGSALVLITLALVVIIAMAGLALDGGDMLLHKTRLQNAVDSAALHGARELDDSDDPALAQAAARTAFEQTLAEPGNRTLLDSYNAGELDIEVQFSDSLNPFSNNDTPPYVRVIATGLDLQSWLIQVVGFDSKSVSASAVSGPSPGLNGEVCNVLPILACGCDPDTDASCPQNSYFGYEAPADNQISSLTDVSVLKIAAGNGTDLGPGNFRFLRLGDNTGASDLRDALAGVTQESCATVGNDASTETGQNAGPVNQGLNTRFGDYSGPIPATAAPSDVWVDYSPDLLSAVDDGNGGYAVSRAGGTSGLIDYATYNAAVEACEEGNGTNCVTDTESTPVIARRRELILPVGACSEDTSGQGDVTIFGTACFFLIQPVSQQGSEAWIFGQFFESGCSASGTFSPNPPPGPQPTRIILYRDAGSADS